MWVLAAPVSAYVDKAELPALQSAQPVISHRLLMGRTLVHVYSAGAPDASFSPAVPDLEDAYFASIKGHLAQEAAPALQATAG